jgi:hypothetical protein
MVTNRSKCESVRFASLNEIGPRQKRCNEAFQSLAVFLAESVQNRAVDVEHAEHHAILDQRDHDLSVRGGVAGDVAGEGVHIRNQQRAPLGSRGAAYALAERDTRARDLALEWADQQFLAVAVPGGSRHVEAGSVQFGDGVVDEGGELRRVGHQVALAFEDAFHLAREHGVFGLSTAGGDDVHGNRRRLDETAILSNRVQPPGPWFGAPPVQREHVRHADQMRLNGFETGRAALAGNRLPARHLGRDD